MLRRATLELGLLLGALALWPGVAAAADPCAVPRPRSLVFSGGGSKGAFEAGAAYHLIVHRGCDFGEISGNSVGAINGALLAQAAAASDAGRSLANLRDAAESLVEQWVSLDRPRAVMRARPLGKIRFALFGLDSVEDLEPLRRFIEERVALERLAAGRELRVGVITFVDGRYHEIIVNAAAEVDARSAHELVFASAIVPVFGRMPQLALPPAGANPLQLADGGVRHATPVTSYFTSCRPAGDTSAVPLCAPLTGASTPPHPRTEQLFVVVTSPFARRNDLRPVVDARAFDRSGGTITDGRPILVRLFDLLVDTMYRDDLDDMLTYNELLEWHARAAATGVPLPLFPLGSYHRAGAPDSPSLPYEIAVVAPEREDSDPMAMFEVTAPTQRRQLYCGCIAADAIMQAQFGLASLGDRCRTRFPGLTSGRGAAEVPLAPAICRAEPLPVPVAPPAPRRVPR